MKNTFKKILAGVLLSATAVISAFAVPEAVNTADLTAEVEYAENSTAALMSISGSGTVEDPFLVVTEEDLMLVSDFPDCHFKLANDIALTSTNWEPLCVLTDPFSGVFDGDGYTISNLTITTSNGENGLFSENAGTIKNLNVETGETGVYLSTYTGIFAAKNSGTIENCNVSGKIYRSSGDMTAVYCGGFVGYNTGSVENCTASGNIDVSICISSSSDTFRIFVGGFAGYNTSSISKCSAEVDVSVDKSGYSYSSSYNRYYYDYRMIGGFLGGNVGGSLTSCFNQGTLNVGGCNSNGYYSSYYTYFAKCYAGGLIGSNHGTVENCATVSTISAIDSYVTIYSGGLSIYNSGVSSTKGTITNCYAVTSGELTYGLAYNSTVTNSFYDKTVSGKTDTSYGTPKSTAAMKMALTYTNAGWNFDETWAISEDINDGYPYLQWMYETTYKITYDANGGEGAPDSQRKLEDVDLTLSDVIPTREGYKFVGWSADASATEAEYLAGGTYSVNEEVTLYAVWEKVYYITYNANGGENAPETQIKEKNVAAFISLEIPSRTGYKFLGWATESDAVEPEYLAGAGYTLNSDVDLYAVWEALYVISYDVADIELQYKEKDVDVNLSSVIPVMENREFLGWTTTEGSDVVEYNAGDVYSTNADLTLYSVWKNLYVDIALEEKSASGNLRYYEVDGLQYTLTENADNVLTVMPQKDMLIEVVEKETADSIYTVSTKYYFVDYETLTYSEISLDSFTYNKGNASIRVNENTGIRFLSNLSTLAKKQETDFVIEEYGFIVARQKLLDAANAQLNFDFAKHVKGVAYNKYDGTNIIFDSSNDEYHVISGVLCNIPESAYSEKVTSKTYAKISINGQSFTVYGEPVSASLYEIAKSLVDSEEISDEIRTELENIISKVEPEPEPEPEPELDNEIEVEGDGLFN